MNVGNAKVVVAGGASGLGLGVVKHMLTAGASVAAIDLHESLPDSLDPAVFYVHADVREEREVEDALRQAAARFGRITLVVNCAGIAHAEKVVGRDRIHSQHSFERVVAVNLVGTFNVIKAAADLMRANPATPDGERGVIITTGSIAAAEGQVGLAAYAASKGGVASMTLPLARELAAYGVRVMTVAPGIFETPMMNGMSDAVRAQLDTALVFPDRPGQPEEFAALVAHIYANPMLNGVVVRLDGAVRLPYTRSKTHG